MDDNSYNVLPEYVDSLEDLEQWMKDYSFMSHDRRKLSNDMSLEKYGLNNLDRYNILKGILSSNEDPNENTNDTIEDAEFKQSNPVQEGSTEIEVMDPNSDHWRSISDAIRRADSQGMVIVCSPDNWYLGEYGPEDDGYEIKMRWNKFLSLSSDLRNLSNQTSLMILGMDNYTYYSKFINKQMERDFAKHNHAVTNDSIRPERYLDTTSIAPVSTYYSPSEMNDFKQTSPLISESGDIKDTNKWINELTNLSTQLKYTNNSSKRESIKEQIHSLGWNPEIPFCLEAAQKVSSRYIKNIEIIDARDMLDEATKAMSKVNKKYTYEYLKDKIVPVYICLSQGAVAHSKAIQWFTNSQWSHAAIGFESTLEPLYSFNLYKDGSAVVNGFSIEGLRRYALNKKDARIKVFALFVTPEQRDIMKEAIQWYIDNQDKTSYSFGTIFDIVTRKNNKNYDDKDKKICSQFVYSILSLAQFRMRRTKVNNIVTPADLDELADDARMYCMYEGNISEYKSQVTDKLCREIIPALPLEMYGINESTGEEMVYPKSAIVSKNSNDNLMRLAKQLL